jgi:hypothetical protein
VSGYKHADGLVWLEKPWEQMTDDERRERVARALTGYVMHRWWVEEHGTDDW